MSVAAILALLIGSSGTLGIIMIGISPHVRRNAYYWLSAELLAHLGFLLALLFLMHVVRQRQSPRSSLAWVLVILFLPYLGVPLYLLTRHRKMRRMARRLVILLLPCVGVPLGLVLGERKMRRLVRWRERINQPAPATRQRSEGGH